MWDKIVVVFFLFGCWAKHIPDTIGFLIFNIWYVLVLFWMILNGLGVLNFLFNKKADSSIIQNKINDEFETKWLTYNLIAVVSYAMSGCYWVALFFMLTSFLFAMLVIGDKKDNDKKKKNK